MNDVWVVWHGDTLMEICTSPDVALRCVEWLIANEDCCRDAAIEDFDMLPFRLLDDIP